MIPILYRREELNFNTNGLGRLSECISCTVTEERNGIYELEFTYPVTGRFYDQMVSEGGCVAVIHDDNHDLQPFDIYKYSAPIDGVVTFNAHHISYRLGNVILQPFTAESCADALDQIPANALNNCPFSFWTDKMVSGEFALTTPDNARAILGGQEGSILDVYGKGDYQFNKFEVRLYTNRGNNSGVTIRYGKNMVDINHTVDRSGTFSAIAPFWANDEQTITLPEGFVVSPTTLVYSAPWTDENGENITDENGNEIWFDYPFVVPVQMDFSSNFSEPPTVEELRAAAVAYLANNEPWLPDDNVTVDFVQLWQTPEYANVASLQRVRLCDLVSVYFPELGVIKSDQKVIKVVYNVLLERYDSMELGKVSTTLSEAITREADATIKEQTSAMRSFVEHQTALITGGLGGHVVFNLNANGEPQEILIMDTDDMATAVNVIRMNMAGIGFSTTGYEGPFTSAWTIDGKFNADFISTGNLLANFIKGGTLTLGGLNNSDGVFRLNNASGDAVVTMNNGGINTTILNASEYIKVDGDYNSSIKIPFTSDKSQYALFDKDGFSFVLQNAKLFNGLAVQSGVGWVGTFVSEGDDSTGARRDLSIYPGSLYASFVPSGSSSATYSSELRYDGLFLQKASGTPFFGADAANGSASVYGSFYVSGTKSRIAETEDYGERRLYCYETPSPLFGDVGEGEIGEDGLAFIPIDPKFSETITTNNYQVFLQKYGEGDAFVFERKPGYFIVKGTPGLAFGWEMKAKQKDFDQLRLEKHVEPYTPPKTDFGGLAITYLNELKEGRLSA